MNIAKILTVLFGMRSLYRYALSGVSDCSLTLKLRLATTGKYVFVKNYFLFNVAVFVNSIDQA